MLRLETFGSLVLAGDSGTPLPIQRRRLALLALLSTAGKRGVRRDKLVAVLWPDSTEPKARHALEQLIYSLRQHQSEQLVVGPDPLRINHHVLSVDAMEFLGAIERGDAAEAIRLYRGPFLGGFYLSGAPEFESWVETERRMLAGKYRTALERRAAELEPAAAVEAWRSLVAADPFNGSARLALMRGLVAQGDRAAAWREGKDYESVLRRELNRDVDPEVRRLIAELGA